MLPMLAVWVLVCAASLGGAHGLPTACSSSPYQAAVLTASHARHEVPLPEQRTVGTLGTDHLTTNVQPQVAAPAAVPAITRDQSPVFFTLRRRSTRHPLPESSLPPPFH